MNYYELFRIKYTRIHLREFIKLRVLRAGAGWAGFGTVFETGESAVYFVLASKDVSSSAVFHNCIMTF